jgi:hypothetical protein
MADKKPYGNRFGGEGNRRGGFKFGKSAANDPKEKRGDPGPGPAKSAMNEASAAWKPKAKTTWAGAGGRTMAGAGGTNKMSASGDSWWSKSTLGQAFAGKLDKTPMNPSKVSGTVRNTGAGRSGAKGDEPKAPAKSAKMSATTSFKGEQMSKPKAAPAKPAKPAYKAKGPADYNKDLGRLYLQATENMHSGKAGGKKK